MLRLFCWQRLFLYCLVFVEASKKIIVLLLSQIAPFNWKSSKKWCFGVVLVFLFQCLLGMKKTYIIQNEMYRQYLDLPKHTRKNKQYI